MLHWPAFLLFFITIFLQEKGFLFSPEKHSLSFVESKASRYPASVDSSCYEVYQELEVIKNPQSRFHLWKRFFGLPQERFDHQRYRALVEEYGAREPDRLYIDVEESPEALVALTRVVADKIGLASQPDLRLNRFKEAALERVVKRLKEKGTLESAQIEDLTRDLYLTAYGPEIPLKRVLRGKSAQDEAILRIVQQDLLSRGLVKVFKDYRYSKSHPTFLQRFRQSKWGRAALTGLFNLPMYLGTPPMYLPGKKPIVLSDELAGEILEKGLRDDGVVRRLEMELGGRVLTPLRYELFKNYYLKGVMVYVTLAGFYDFYQLNKELDQEQAVIQEATDEAVRILNMAENLEQSGIDIFSDDGVQEGKSFCDAIFSCLNTLGVQESALRDDPSLFEEEVATCRSLMDPDNRCTKL